MDAYRNLYLDCGPSTKMKIIKTYRRKWGFLIAKSKNRFRSFKRFVSEQKKVQTIGKLVETTSKRLVNKQKRLVNGQEKVKMAGKRVETNRND